MAPQWPSKEDPYKENFRRTSGGPKNHTKTVLKHLKTTQIHPQKLPKASPRSYLLWRTSWCLYLLRRAETSRWEFRRWYNRYNLPSLGSTCPSSLETFLLPDYSIFLLARTTTYTYEAKTHSRHVLGAHVGPQTPGKY